MAAAAAAAVWSAVWAVLEQAEAPRIMEAMEARVGMHFPPLMGFRFQEAVVRIFWITQEAFPLQRPRPAVWEEQALRVAPAAWVVPAGMREAGLQGIPGALLEEEEMAVLPAPRLQAWEVMAGRQQPPITDFMLQIQALDQIKPPMKE